MTLVCPRCKGELTRANDSFRCEGCQAEYPVVCGIPDFRLWPDPYISIAEDREKGQLLWDAARNRSFEELLRHYYAITKEDPPDLAEFWIAHSLAEPSIAARVLNDSGLSAANPGAVLDIGCSTGALLIAADAPGREVVGMDVAFRWLIVGKARLRDAGVDAKLICANAEALPFAGGTFDCVTAQDVLEHLRDPTQALAECYRVLRPGTSALWTTNNRLTPLPEPHVRLWGVGYLPRAWQRGYVAMRRKDLHPYGIRMRSAWELRRLFRAAKYASTQVNPAPLFAPHWGDSFISRLLYVYNRIRVWPVVRSILRLIGPRLWVKARR